jgi:hypothetical protein
MQFSSAAAASHAPRLRRGSFTARDAVAAGVLIVVTVAISAASAGT